MPIALFGMVQEVDKYKGEVIDAQSLTTMGAKMPDDISLTVEVWKEKYKELLYTLIHDTNELPLTPESLIQHKNRVYDVIRKERLKNLSTTNYVFELKVSEGKICYIQCAGSELKAINTINGNKDEQGKNYQLFDRYLDKKIDNLEHIPTYLTPSRFAHYLRASDIIDKEKILYFKVPPTYLTQIPGRTDMRDGAYDGNCIVVQEKLEGTMFADNNLRPFINLNKLKEQAIIDMLKVVKYTPLWDTQVNLNIFEDGSLGQSDLEQSVVDRPQDFFHKNRELFSNYISNAACGFAKVLKRGRELGIVTTPNFNNVSTWFAYNLGDDRVLQEKVKKILK
jgi:hypothetical protein